MPPSPSLRASSSSCPHTHSASVPTRRIKFAPLPEPTPQFDSDAIVDTPLRTESPLPLDTIHIHHTPSKPKPKTSLSRQFNFFKRSSTDPPTDRPRPCDIGAPHSRFTFVATPSISQPRRLSTAPSLSNTKPCSSTNSLGGHAMPPNSFLNPSQSTPTRPTVPTSGIRMLNGRVYGSKRQTLTNPFASARNEPDFVEWGYGGMGSVSCSSDSKYSVLAKGAPALLSNSHAHEILVGSGRSGAARERKDGVDVSDVGGGDDDDGSGMGWVRKRRQARTARERQGM
ncbi:hypothetical protein DFH29DRAFT_997632 [Suillus ampliporus]|nr:hypothetical protein DFH29DRAFT_997632 [Suillus ampliporus]